MVVTVWKEAGFFMIFYLAALQTMPTDLGEAAALEGSSRWNYFRRVTLPLLMPFLASWVEKPRSLAILNTVLFLMYRAVSGRIWSMASLVSRTFRRSTSSPFRDRGMQRASCRTKPPTNPDAPVSRSF